MTRTPMEMSAYRMAERWHERDRGTAWDVLAGDAQWCDRKRQWYWTYSRWLFAAL